MKHFLPEKNVYVYFRYTDEKTVMVIINNGVDNQKINTNRFQESIKNYTMGTDILSGKTLDLNSELTLEGKSVVILELK